MTAIAVSTATTAVTPRRRRGAPTVGGKVCHPRSGLRRRPRVGPARRWRLRGRIHPVHRRRGIGERRPVVHSVHRSIDAQRIPTLGCRHSDAQEGPSVQRALGLVPIVLSLISVPGWPVHDGNPCSRPSCTFDGGTATVTATIGSAAEPDADQERSGHRSRSAVPRAEHANGHEHRSRSTWPPRTSTTIEGAHGQLGRRSSSHPGRRRRNEIEIDRESSPGHRRAVGVRRDRRPRHHHDAGLRRRPESAGTPSSTFEVTYPTRHAAQISRSSATSGDDLHPDGPWRIESDVSTAVTGDDTIEAATLLTIDLRRRRRTTDIDLAIVNASNIDLTGSTVHAHDSIWRSDGRSMGRWRDDTLSDIETIVGASPWQRHVLRQPRRERLLRRRGGIDSFLPLGWQRP